jgi:putative hydrolase of the HAD superfamily
VTGSTRAVLFDLDDTLYPERQFVDGGFGAVASFLAGASARPAPDLAARLRELHERDGRGRLFDTLLAELGLDGDPDLVPACLLVYRSHDVEITPYPGAIAALDRLRDAGIRTGVVSDGNAAVQERKLRGLDDLAKRLDVVVLTDDLGPGRAKPSPIGFRVACRLLEVSPSTTIYVGNDPRKDFAGARAAGLRTIRIGPVPDVGGSTTSTAPADDADVTADSFDALSTMLSGMTS